MMDRISVRRPDGYVFASELLLCGTSIKRRRGDGRRDN